MQVLSRAATLVIIMAVLVASAGSASFLSGIEESLQRRILAEQQLGTESVKAVLNAVRDEGSSLSQRAKALRENAVDLVESAKLLANRADELSQRTNDLIGSSQRSLRERRSVATAKSNCPLETCTAACVMDCTFLCGNTVFFRPSECDTPAFCESKCSAGCQVDACDYHFAFDAASKPPSVPNKRLRRHKNRRHRKHM